MTAGARGTSPAGVHGLAAENRPAGAERLEARPLLVVRELRKDFLFERSILGRRRAMVHAVDGVTFTVERAETLALVGESGCGKTTTGRAILRLIEPTAGSVEFDGVDVLALGRRALRALRRRMQPVFQDPYSSLNPRRTVGSAIGEGLRIHRLAEGAAVDARVAQLLSEVGLSPEYGRRHPHELSGGQRQRVGIARALAVEPDLMVCDEPVSALDVSVQAQVLNLLLDLQRTRGLTYLFIAHDLAVVAQVATRVAVMYAGRMVELGSSAAVYRDPIMPYTRVLLAAIPVLDPRARRQRALVVNDPPPGTASTPGCPFYPRCPHPDKDVACTRVVPPLEEKAPGHWAACIKETVRFVGTAAGAARSST